jgi:hypothetical protein
MVIVTVYSLTMVNFGINILIILIMILFMVIFSLFYFILFYFALTNIFLIIIEIYHNYFSCG